MFPSPKLLHIQSSFTHHLPGRPIFCAAFCQSMPSNESRGEGRFHIVKEELVYSRYLNVYNRTVEIPGSETRNEERSTRQTVDYDLVGSKTVSFHFGTVFPFDSQKKTVRLIREYAQGANDFLYGVPTGGLSEKHESLEDCVMKELSEEAHLRGGTLVKLIPDEHSGILEVKWCRNRFTPFLILDPERDPTPLSHDLEEIIETFDVDLRTLNDIMYGGNMMLPSIVTCNMALRYLQEHSII